MSRAISVKVATAKVLKALEAKLATVKSDKSNEAINEKKYRDAHAKWQKQVIAIAIKSKRDDENCSVHTRSYGDTHQVNLQYEIKKSELPEEPDRDFTTINDWQYKELVEEIQNALNILRMTDDEFVPATTMRGISKYL
jgi:hypothetical protein